jgi:hypothetical protein
MVTGRAYSASDSNRSARSARTAGDDRHKVEARAWSGDTSWQRTRRAGTKVMRNRPAKARASRRRKAPLPPRSGGWEVVPTCVPGDGGAPRV